MIEKSLRKLHKYPDEQSILVEEESWRELISRWAPLLHSQYRDYQSRLEEGSAALWCSRGSENSPNKPSYSQTNFCQEEFLRNDILVSPTMSIDHMVKSRLSYGYTVKNRLLHTKEKKLSWLWHHDNTLRIKKREIWIYLGVFLMGEKSVY